MVHVQLYDGHLTEAEVNARKSWKMGDPQPDRLLDPSAYLKAASANPRLVAVMSQPIDDNVEDAEDGEGTPEGDAANARETAPAASSSPGPIAALLAAAVVIAGFRFFAGR